MCEEEFCADHLWLYVSHPGLTVVSSVWRGILCWPSLTLCLSPRSHPLSEAVSTGTSNGAAAADGEDDYDNLWANEDLYAKVGGVQTASCTDRDVLVEDLFHMVIDWLGSFVYWFSFPSSSFASDSKFNCYKNQKICVRFLVRKKWQKSQNRSRSARSNGASHVVHGCSYNQRKLNNVLWM